MRPQEQGFTDNRREPGQKNDYTKEYTKQSIAKQGSSKIKRRPESKNEQRRGQKNGSRRTSYQMERVFNHYKTIRTKKANKATGRITSSDKTLIEL